ncbi:MAG: hypothetical protein JWQ21_610 [Herminiimonas sp.]|nr:hypothetical protein [Herminiimonas sp.]
MKPNVNVVAAAALVADLMQQNASSLTIWKAIDEALAEALGHRLFTVLAYADESAKLVRLYSSRPEVNPVGGMKDVVPSPWAQSVLIAGEPYIGRTREDIKEVFFDHEILWGIGCESVLNMPVRLGGRSLGSLNMLDVAGNYDVEDIPVAKIFAQLTAPVLLSGLREAQRLAQS